MKRDTTGLVPLSPPVFHILLALSGGERHGYGILLDIEAQTDGAVRLGTGTLYTAIRRLLDCGLIEESDQRPDVELDDERRRYYRLTSSGRRVALAEARRLESLVGLARERRLLPRPSGRGS
jgi:DNA-binding PadR family transcriptional regulator